MTESAAVVAGSAGSTSTQAAAPQAGKQAPGFYRYKVGSLEVTVLTDGARSFALVRWGLIPAWVKEPNAFSLLINARGETVGDKPAFRNAMRYRRCLFPADGFYEWKSEGARKRPFCIRPRDGDPLGHLLAEAEQRVAAGFSAFKLKLGFGIDDDVRLCQAVHRDRRSASWSSRTMSMRPPTRSDSAGRLSISISTGSRSRCP